MILRIAQVLALILTVGVWSQPGSAQGQQARQVGSAQELNEALAAGASTIALKPGVYREIVIRDRQPAATVALVAADPAQPPVVNRLVVLGSGRLLIRNWRFVVDLENGLEGALADVQRSRDIAFEAVHFAQDASAQARPAQTGAGQTGPAQTGPTPAAPPLAAPVADGRWRGLSGLDVEGLAVRDSTFSGLDRGLVIQRGRQLAIAHNLFSNMRGAGVNLVEADTTQIDSNRFNGFQAEPGRTGTFIHVWTRGATLPSRRLTIRHNVMIQDTAVAAQGIMLSNEERIPFSDVVVENNIVVVGSPHGISIDRAESATIRGNVVLDTVNSTFNGAVRMSRVTGGEVSGNLAAAFGMSENRDIVLRRNATMSRLETRTRELHLQRLRDGLAGRGEARIHAQHAVTAAQRASGPRI
jgi:hypothetical protein